MICRVCALCHKRGWTEFNWVTQTELSSVVWDAPGHPSWLQLLLQEVTGPRGSGVMLPAQLLGPGPPGVCSGTWLVPHSGVGSNQTKPHRKSVSKPQQCARWPTAPGAVSWFKRRVVGIKQWELWAGNPSLTALYVCQVKCSFRLHSFPGVFCSRGWRSWPVRQGTGITSGCTSTDTIWWIASPAFPRSPSLSPTTSACMDSTSACWMTCVTAGGPGSSQTSTGETSSMLCTESAFCQTSSYILLWFVFWLFSLGTRGRKTDLKIFSSTWQNCR